MERLLACGIRDWGKDPYGAAVHVWRPGQQSWAVAHKLAAFSLNGGLPNVHICGDAYSDYQGFIEGALRSAGMVLRMLRTNDRKPVKGWRQKEGRTYEPITVRRGRQPDGGKP
jgi:hypothetical protein